ncbi:hypothetical protein ACTU44_12070 [Thalassospira sp. SM2505]
MLKLSMPTEPYWMDLPLDVRLRVRPCTTPIIEFATSKAIRVIADIEKGISDLRMVGHDAESLRKEIQDPDYRAGIMQFVYAQKLALAAVIEWDGAGVMTDAGDVAPVTEDHMRDVMLHPSIARTFVAKYTEPVRAVEAEGNA